MQVVKALLEAGADVALTDAKGNTPLHYAAGDRNNVWSKAFFWCIGTEFSSPLNLQGAIQSNIGQERQHTPMLVEASLAL